ncbi:MAG: phosphatidate cytidylyltransferase [Aggregatilineales bacterium]
MNKTSRGAASWINRELAIRLLTGFTLGPVVLAVVYFGGPLFGLLVLGMGIVAAIEFGRVAQLPRIATYALVAATIVLIGAGYTRLPALALPAVAIAALGGLVNGTGQQRIDRAGWTLLGTIYVGIPLGLCVAIRESPLGLVWIFGLLITNWATDSFAYIGGHWFGSHLLAPSVSPHKTWEGTIFGVLCGIALALLFNAAAHTLSVQTIGISVLTAPASVVGDLLESAFKRQFGTKDSGQLLPGHGGILDRIDGLLLACAAVGLFLALT